MRVPNTRRLGTACAVTAVGIGIAIVAGCGQQVSGTAAANGGEVSAYKSEVAASSAAASSSKKAAQDAAVKANCVAFSVRTGSAVDTYNAFIDALNDNAPDLPAKKGAAAAAMRNAADETEGDAGDKELPSDYVAKLEDYVSAARDQADQVDRVAPNGAVDALNNAAHRHNDARSAVTSFCKN